MNSDIPDPRYLIWRDYPAVGQFQPKPFWRGFEQCNRAGGGYIASDEAIDMIQFPTGVPINEEDKNKLRARLTTLLVDQHRLGVRFPEVTTGLIDTAISKSPLPIHERADRLLRYIEQRSRTIGQHVDLNRHSRDQSYPTDPYGHPKLPSLPSNPVNLEAMAWSESVSAEEVEFLADFLNEKGWTREVIPQSLLLQLTVEGHSRVADQQVAIQSSRAFVAMWFDESMDEAYQKGTKPAIENVGYEPFKINDKPDVDKIDDEIIGEIRRSRFLVADFTHGAQGARGGVYYEAGFAYGLGLHVVRSCRKDIIDKNELHFDVRQHYHVVWETVDELRDGLEKRIRALIGQGPIRTR